MNPIPAEDGHLIQATWVLKYAFETSWIMRKADPGYMSAVGSLTMTDGRQSVVTLKTDSHVSFPFVFEEMNRIMNYHKAGDWELAGMEGKGGGLFLPSSTVLREPNLGLRCIDKSRYARERDDMFVVTI